MAPDLLVQIYSEHGSSGKFAKWWIKAKELEHNHVANEMIMIAMVLDKIPNCIGTEGCEILASRVYALRRAFSDVKGINDWRQPKGANAAKWKSKVRWDLANAVDLRSLNEMCELIPNVEADISKALRDKALFLKYLTDGGSPDTHEDS